MPQCKCTHELHINSYQHLDLRSKEYYLTLGRDYNDVYFARAVGWTPYPKIWNLTLEDIDAAIKYFNSIAPTLKGILRARPINVPEHAPPPLHKHYSQWAYNYLSYTYFTPGKNQIKERGRLSRMYNILDRHVELLRVGTEGFLLGQQTVDKWYDKTSNRVAWGNIASYLFGKGGKNNINDEDMNNMESQVRAQQKHFQNFATSVGNNSEGFEDGEGMSHRQILARTQQYGEAATHMYELGSIRAKDLELPEYPADGQQICHSNCRCHWDIDEESDLNFILCYWKLEPTAEHCASCIGNNRKWNPLRIPKAGGPPPAEGLINTTKAVVGFAQNVWMVGKNIRQILRNFGIPVPSAAELAIQMTMPGSAIARLVGYNSTQLLQDWFKIRATIIEISDIGHQIRLIRRLLGLSDDIMTDYQVVRRGTAGLPALGTGVVYNVVDPDVEFTPDRPVPPIQPAITGGVVPALGAGAIVTGVVDNPPALTPEEFSKMIAFAAGSQQTLDAIMRLYPGRPIESLTLEEWDAAIPSRAMSHDDSEYLRVRQEKIQELVKILEALKNRQEGVPQTEGYIMTEILREVEKLATAYVIISQRFHAEFLDNVEKLIEQREGEV